MPPNLFAVSLPSLGRLLPQEGQMAAAAPPPPPKVKSGKEGGLGRALISLSLGPVSLLEPMLYPGECCDWPG